MKLKPKKVNKKDKIIRVGDTVRIVNPEVFVRCGYPLTIDAEQEAIQDKHTADIKKLLEQVGIDPRLTAGTFESTIGKIARAIAYISVKQKGFGGKERKIYTQRQEELKDRIVQVYQIFFVKTGTYHPPHYYSSFEGEDWEPGYLDKEQTHKILEFSDSSYFCYPEGCPRIEAVNVEKVIET